MADVIRVNARSLVRLADGIHPRDVAALADAGLTAYHAVKKAASRLTPGTSAAVIGCGGLGHIAIQLLRSMTAARVLAVDQSDEALALATSVGADAGVSSNLVEGVMKLTDGKGAEAVFDFVGEGGVSQEALQVVAPSGTYYAIGYGDTPIVPTLDLVLREVSVVGNLVGTFNDLTELMTLHSSGRVRVETRFLSLDDAPRAFEDLRDGRVRGRTVLIPES